MCSLFNAKQWHQSISVFTSTCPCNLAAITISQCGPWNRRIYHAVHIHACSTHTCSPNSSATVKRGSQRASVPHLDNDLTVRSCAMSTNAWLIIAICAAIGVPLCRHSMHKCSLYAFATLQHVCTHAERFVNRRDACLGGSPPDVNKYRSSVSCFGPPPDDLISSATNRMLEYVYM